MEVARISTAPLSVVSPGEVIDGKYRVKNSMGATETSVVLEVEGVTDGRRYSMRVFDTQALSRAPGGMKALTRDAQRLMKITSPHALRTLATGSLGRGAPYVVMEWVVGVSMARMLKDVGALSMAEACVWMTQACDALGQAHSLGIVHRDVRPANLFIAEDRKGARMLKVASFGLGPIVDGLSAGGDDDGGPALYASPELLLGNPLNPRSDVWSIGATLYELVTGKRPFTLEELTAMVASKQFRVPPPLKSPMNAPIPDSFSQIVLRCLAAFPTHRYADANEVGEALAALSRLPASFGAGGAAAPPPPRSSSSAAAAPDDEEDPNATRVAPLDADAMNAIRSGAFAAPRSTGPQIPGLGPPTPGLPAPPPRTRPLPNDAVPDGDATIVFNATGEGPVVPRVPSPRMSPQAQALQARPAFGAMQSYAEEEVPDSATMVRPGLDAQQMQQFQQAMKLPPIKLEELPSAKWHLYVLGVLALVALLCLPLIYIHARAKRMELPAADPSASVDPYTQDPFGKRRPAPPPPQPSAPQTMQPVPTMQPPPQPMPTVQPAPQQ
jgi:serine/threonine-protein kinase